MPMKPLLESLKRARHIEWFALIVIIALACGIWLNMDRDAQEARSSEKTSIEARLEDILSRIDGSGQVSVMITTQEDGAVEGAVVVMNGGGGIRTIIEMQSAIQTLLNIELRQIQIIEASDRRGMSIR